MQQLIGTERGSERQPETIRDSERKAATPWNRRNGKIEPASIRDSERHAATPRN